MSAPLVIPQYKDFTLKAKLPCAAEMERVLHSMNAQFVGKDLQTDHYFETHQGKLKWREGTIENLITHYQRFDDGEIERTVVYRYDLNPSKEMINHLVQNHKQIGTIIKERNIYRLDNIKIHLDKLPNEEEFIEIEAIDTSNRFTMEELREQCMTLKANLKIPDHDLVPTGYWRNP